MKNIINLLVVMLTFITLSMETALAATAKGNADVYKVTMRKIELCTGYTVVDFDNVHTADACHNAVVIGSGDKEVDIASVSAGAAAASYGDPALLPLGETYTHMRVTVDRKFIIKSETALDTGGSNDTDNCVTTATTDSQFPSNESTDKYTHRVAVAEGGTNAEMNMYMINGRQSDESTANYTQCFNANCSQKNTSWNWNYAKDASELTSAIAMRTMRSSLTTDDIQLVYALSTPYTVSLIPPTIDISFGTRSALGVQEVCDAGSNCTGETDGMCSFYPEEPIVTITIK